MRRALLLIVLVTALFLLIGRAVTAIAVDHAWFEAMGFPQLFWEQLADRAIMQGGAWLLGSIFAFFNLYAVRRTIAAVAMQSRIANLEFTSMVPSRRLLSATLILSLITGLVLALPMNDWTSVALVRHGLPFGEIEGVLGRDLGFYVYWLPFEETWYLWSLVSVVSLTAMVIVLYALTRSLRLEGNRLAASTHVRRHLSVLGAIILVLLAWSYRLDAFDLLQYGSGPDGVFLKIDHRIVQRMDWLLSVVCAIAAAVVLRAGWVGQFRAAFVTVALVLGAAITLRHLAPALISRTELLGAASVRDRDYFEMRAIFSRRAFGVDRIQTVARDSLSHRANSLASRTSLWDERSLREALGAGAAAANTQEDVGPLTVSERPADLRQSSIVSDRLSTQPVSIGWTYQNDGIKALVVRRPNVDGQLWRASVIDVTKPVLSETLREYSRESGELGVNEGSAFSPLVAPGLSTVQLIDRKQSPDIPGATVGSKWSHIAHAWALRDTRFLGGGLDSSSLVVSHRDVRDRVKQLAPIFIQGREVYPIREKNRLYWALHLYGASDRYPLSLRWLVGGEAFSYFRLSATALVEAGTGRVNLVSAPAPDAVTRTWMRLLPNLFVSPSELPASLVAQLPPAIDGATAQIRTFVRYGSRHSEPLLRYLPDSAISLAGAAPVFSSLQQQEDAPGIIGFSIPVLNQDDDFDGLLTISGGPERSTSWTEIEGSKSVSWNDVSGRLAAALSSNGAAPALPDSSRGSADDSPLGAPPPDRLSRVRVFITNNGVWGEQVRFSPHAPLVIERVAIADSTKAASGITLSDALVAFGVPVPSEAASFVHGNPESGAQDGTSLRARQLYDFMRRALRAGDWNAFGAAFDSLGVVLGRSPP